MSYNPTLANGGRNKRRKRTLDPHAGIKHSDIVRRRGVGSVAPSGSKQEGTPHGFKNLVFKCDSFIQYYECMYSGNHTGFGVNEEGDRILRIMRGSLFVTVGSIDEDGNVTGKDTKQVSEGSYLNFKRGQPYSLATSGTMDVELVITETVDYDKTWRTVEAPLSNVDAGEVIMVAPGQTKTPRRREPRETSKAMEQAQRASAKRRGRPVAHQQNTSASTANNVVIGVNPRPGGPRAFKD